VEIVREASDSQSTAYRSALQELASGNYAGARVQFGQIAGGGRVQDPEKGTVAFKPFSDSAGAKGKEKWYVDGAQYHYAKASYLEGMAKNDLVLVDDALRALDAESAGEKGFLVRYKEGKSRWYADAWLLKGRCQVALKKYDEAAATFDGLYDKVLKTAAIGARFAYEAKSGAGQIAEAKGAASDASIAYESAAAALQSLLEQATDNCSRADLGRYYNEARMQKARVLLDAATKNDAPTDFAQLRKYLESGTPDGLRTKFAGKPKDVVDAVVAGALAPTVQAVAQNGIGLSLLNEKRFAEAVFAFVDVRIKYFSVTSEVPRALYYLGKAADAASAAATRPEAKSLYKAQSDAARQELQRAWKDSPWATKLASDKPR
jgi:TolA-binding protein